MHTSFFTSQGVPLGLDVQPVLVPEGVGGVRRQLRRGGSGALHQGAALRHLRQLQPPAGTQSNRKLSWHKSWAEKRSLEFWLEIDSPLLRKW